MLRVTQRLIRAERAAIAPTVALSLFGLIAAGGLAFDYARLAAMDTELQNAADQAALAAATQLDRVAADEETGDIVAVRQGNVFGISFHPELTADPRIHVWWLGEVLKAQAVGMTDG